LKICVTQEDIDKGVPFNASSPIALAIKRELNAEAVSVSHNSVLVWSADVVGATRFRITYKMKQFIKKFDIAKSSYGELPEPFCFELEDL
jgi:hypothetical protein